MWVASQRVGSWTHIHGPNSQWLRVTTGKVGPGSSGRSSRKETQVRAALAGRTQHQHGPNDLSTAHHRDL